MRGVKGRGTVTVAVVVPIDVTVGRGEGLVRSREAAVMDAAVVAHSGDRLGCQGHRHSDHGGDTGKETHSERSNEDAAGVAVGMKINAGCCCCVKVRQCGSYTGCPATHGRDAPALAVVATAELLLLPSLCLHYCCCCCCCSDQSITLCQTRYGCAESLTTLRVDACQTPPLLPHQHAMDL